MDSVWFWKGASGWALGLVIALSLVFAPSASATQLQAHHLTAEKTAHTWESREFAGTVYVHVYVEGYELEQVWVNRCIGLWSIPGFNARVRVQNCGPGKSAFVLRYRSQGLQRFTVVLDRHS